MNIIFNPLSNNALTESQLKNNDDIIFDLRGNNIFAKGVKFYGTDTNTWRDIKINNVSIGSNILDLRNGSNTTLTNTNGVVTINSTWRPVVDNLTSDSTTSSLSAKQGKILKSLINGKSNSGHTHDDRYLKLTGGTMAGNALITFADSGTNKGPQGARGGLYWTGQSDYAKLYAEETVGDNLDLVIQFGDDNSNGLSIRNKANTQTSYISAGGVITTGTFKGNLDWSYITNKPSSYTPSAHTHAWNSLTHSSTTENQAILTNGKANGWKLYTLNISRWDNAANNAHSHANKSVLDGITSALVNNWNIAYNFVHTITETDTDKVINKWDEIVNFLAGITEDNKLNTLLNNKLSVYKLADNTNVGAIKNNGIYYSTTDASSDTLTNSPFNTGFALINMTSYDGGDDLRRSRLAFNAYGEIKVSNDREQNNTTETWYQVLTSHNTYISNGSGIINGTTITQVDNATNSTNSTNARKLVNWYSARPTSLNIQFGDGSLRIFYATSSTTEGKPAEDSHILHLAWDNNNGQDAQLAVHTRSGKVSTRAQNSGTWQPWKTLAFTTDIPTSLPANGGNADTVDGYHASGLLTSVTNTNNGVSITVGGTTKSVSNISVNYATSAGNADTVDGQHASAFSYKSWWHWSGQSGQPSWIWGGNSENNYYVYNPSNFRVNYAKSAGSVAWNNVTGRPSTFAPAAHTHKWADITDHITKLSQLTNDKGFVTGSVNGNTITINGSSTTWSNTWRPITDDYELGKSDTSLSSLGSLTLYNDLLDTIPNPTDYYWANNKVSNKSTTNAIVQVKAIGVGCAASIDNSIIATNWIRTTGKTGLYFQDYAGGLYMSDNTWIRTWNGKALQVDNTIRSTDFHTTYYANNVWTITSAARLENSTTLIYGSNTSSNSINTYLRGTNVTLQVKKGTSINYNAFQVTANYIYCNNYCDMKVGAAVSGGNFTVQNNSYLAQEAQAKVGIGTTSPTYKLDVNGQVRASGFRHSSVNSDNYVLLAGGGYSQGVPVRYWAIYKIYIGSGADVSYIKRSGNHDFITSYNWQEIGLVTLTINFPSGYSKNNTLIFGNGDHQISHNWATPVYVTIITDTDFGTASQIRILLSSDSSLDTGYANIYFMCMG